MIKTYLHYAVAAAFAVASGASSVAFAVEETANDLFDNPQHLETVDGQAAVTGAIGVTTWPRVRGDDVPDIDYYSFYGYAGNKVTIDIDLGFKAPDATERSLDTIIAIWGPPTTTPDTRFFLPSDDVGTGDADSFPIPESDPLTFRDARLDEVVLPTTGTYTVGVTSGGVFQSVPRTFLNTGDATEYVRGATANGTYKLIISGVSAPVQPAVLPIKIDIRPGVDRIARIDPKSRGVVPVALLSSEGFDARTVDAGSVRFGPTGKEATALRCTKRGIDVNHDRARDMVCLFDNQATRFDASHEKGKITGTIAGTTKQFQGEGWLKVIPVKRKHHKDKDRHHNRGRDDDRDDD